MNDDIYDQLEQLEATHTFVLEKKNAQIERLTKLLLRAADALSSYEAVLDKPFKHPLIEELWKAAE